MTPKAMKAAGEKFMMDYALDLGGRDGPFVRKLRDIAEVAYIYTHACPMPQPQKNEMHRAHVTSFLFIFQGDSPDGPKELKSSVEKCKRAQLQRDIADHTAPGGRISWTHIQQLRDWSLYSKNALRSVGRPKRFPPPPPLDLPSIRITK